ncbi:MAG: N-acetylmuramoyl-L-alanine amidase [Xanthomonadales bacterium PRO7]|nr:N-acetylmuramoyl-L-alanine amidase [Xanthomonadales bacterium PRO7]
MRGVAARIGCFLACAAVLAAPARAAEIRSVKASQSGDRVRVSFDLSGMADYKLFEIANPDRLVIDVSDAAIARGFVAPAATGVLKGVRTGRHGKDGARIVLDLSAAARPKTSVQAYGKSGAYRLIVDLYTKERASAVKSMAALAAKPRDVVVAIDAGHGGVDPGATGAGGTHEKDITLAVARDLAKLIDKQSGMHAVLTRDSDTFIPLQERYQKAREAKADLFVSIHADAYASGDARGSSVWVLSPRGATNEAARWLADRENRADLVGGVKLEDKDNTLAAVLLDLSQGATAEASDAVAKRVLQALAKIGPTHRGFVEKANFVVLRSPDVPSILVETAFISNPSEEKRLKNPAQRQKLATAILDGVRGYFEATPPPGSLFAANARRDKLRNVARRDKAQSDSDAADLADDTVASRSPKS